MRVRIAACAASCAAVAATTAVTAGAATAPPAPKAHGGATVSLFASGLKNPTSFAWGDGAMFAGDSGSSEQVPNGGVDIVARGSSTTVPNGPIFVGGMAFHHGALYLSGGFLKGKMPVWQIQKWSGFTGTDFTKRTVVYTAPKGFQGFNGIAFAPNGRLLVGVDTGLLNGNDHGPASTSPFLYDILSMTARGKDVKVFAKGIRQPWQMAFAPGSRSPFVSDLGQDGPKRVAKLGPPDFVLKVHRGDNYGFPKCNWTNPKACRSATRPFKMFPPHRDIMGLAVIRHTLYMTSFLGPKGKGGALYKMSIHGGRVKPVVTGFPIATDALAAHGGKLYVGGSFKGAGSVYQVTP
jgi:glucose/arabinose dehydrogenase